MSFAEEKKHKMNSNKLTKKFTERNIKYKYTFFI